MSMHIDDLYERSFDTEKYLLPYTSNAEYLAEQMRYLQVCLTLACAARGLSGEGFPTPDEVGWDRGLSVSTADLFGVLTPAEPALTEDAQRQLEDAYFQVECRTRQTAKSGIIFPLESLAVKFGLDEFERFALLLAFSGFYDRKFESVYTYLHNNTAENRPTGWLAVRLWRLMTGEMPASAAALLHGTSPLTRFLTEDTDAGSAQKLVLRSRVSAYIMGEDADAPQLSGYARRYGVEGEPVPVRQESAALAERFFRTHAFRDEGFAVLNLWGPDGIGRRRMAADAAASVGLPLITADIRRLVMLEEKSIARYLDMLYVETMLTGALPCFVSQNREVTSEEEQKFRRDSFDARMEFAAEYIAGLFRFVFWASSERENIFARTNAQYYSIELPMLNAGERRQFWEAWADPAQMAPEIDLDICASQYILTPRDLKRVLDTARELSAHHGEKISKEILRSAIRQHSQNQLGLYATPINAVFTWDDLVVGEEQKRQMQMICNQVRYRRIVGEEWGFRKKSPYGNGLCALFYGSPGTGKTMAVQVMANELGIDLYRIDLSQLVSKYIGETQKNISELFNRAKNINAMLFFDEADSMFAKRSEVKDANDRYANADTAFLLQKLEDYDGITVLATNYVNNIDDAFKRRIKFMVNFVFPAPDVRLALWKKIAPPTARFDEAIDFEFFAENFELTGSNIKEIFTNAAYIAASEGAGIKNCHIVEAIKLNFSKYGKILADDDFGYLGR